MSKHFVNEILSQVSSRLFVASDFSALCAMEEVCFAPQLRFNRGLLQSLAFDPNYRTWLGIAGDVRVGFVIVGLRGEEDPGAAYIWTIEVLPGFRRMGVARQLLTRAEESARNARRESIELHVSEQNLDAIALYEACGYKRCGLAPDFYGWGEHGLRYRKMLPGE